MSGVSTKEAMAKARTLLELVGITDACAKRLPARLSGGEQQRVAIARALSGGAKIILADEPTGNLDLENTEKIIDILSRLAHEQGYCVIIVTHDSEFAEKADTVYRVVEGSWLRSKHLRKTQIKRNKSS